MLDINLIRNDPETLRKNLERRKDPDKLKLLDDLIDKDKEWRDAKFNLQKLQQGRNAVTKEIAMLKKEGKDIQDKLKEMKELPEKVKKEEERVENLKQEIDRILLRIPNMMHESVPYGKDDTENVEIKKVGTCKEFDFEVKNHVQLMEENGWGDFERSAKIAGHGFYFLKGDLALLNQAILRYAIDFMIKRNYLYVEPPLMLKRGPYEGVTDLSDFENVMYKIEGEDSYMIATSEHPLVAQYMNDVIEEKELPIKMVGYSMCFRKEVGSRGIDTKGLFRTHQFNKVEQIIFCQPEESWTLHEEILKNSEDLFTSLELPYRIVNICTGDLGIVAAKKYDLEVWMPRQNAYKEACSASNCTDYQARRLNIKCGKEGGDKRVLHTLNNTAIATSRVLVSILENYQNKDGTVTIPEVLRPYMYGKEKILPL